MTKPKSIANTLKYTIENPIISTIQDRTADIEDVISTVSDYWSFDLYSRKPGPAYTESGEFKGTDLDMAAFLFTLVGRNAVLNIPEYKSMRESKHRDGQMLASKDNRHGQLLQVISNKDTFVFSIRMKDMNVMSTDDVGDYRTFSLTRFDGEWYSGWKYLEFMPTAEENKFIADSKILSEGGIEFKNFVHPNRWTSMYGQYYFITKLLINRLTEQSADYNKQIKRMIKEGVTYPEELTPKKWPKSTASGKKKSIKVPAFSAEIDFPDNDTSFPVFESTQENLVFLTNKRKEWVYKTIPHLRFMTRATEYAFAKHIEQKGLNSFPSWLKDVKWEEGYIEKGKRTPWNRLVLYQPAPGVRGVAIRFRQWEKSERVDENYKG
jgi:hypothetical protein